MAIGGSVYRDIEGRVMASAFGVGSSHEPMKRRPDALP
jgi:hypothetical protein